MKVQFRVKHGWCKRIYLLCFMENGATSHSVHGTWIWFSIERRSVTSVTMVALFLDDNKTNDDDGKEFGKIWYVYIKKQKLARTSRYFVHFFAVVAPLRHETS